MSQTSTVEKIKSPASQTWGTERRAPTPRWVLQVNNQNPSSRPRIGAFHPGCRLSARPRQVLRVPQESSIVHERADSSNNYGVRERCLRSLWI